MPSKFLVLGCLYVSQGLPFGFFMQALPVVLRERDVGLHWIGLSGLLGLPWAFKWLWAPAVDRWGHARLGHFRSWLLPLQLLNVLLLAALAFLPPSQTWLWLLLGCFITNLFAATQDIATDGLAVGVLRGKERGFGNAIQVAGYRLGMILGGGAILALLDTRGWGTALGLLALLTALCSLPVLSYREPARAPLGVSPVGSWLGFLRQPGIGAWLVVLVVYKSADAFGTGMLRPFLVDAGLSMSQIALWVGSVGSICGLLGALAGAWLVRRWGAERGLAVFGALTALSVAAYSAVAWWLPALAHSQLAPLNPAAAKLWPWLIGVEHFVSGMATVSLFTAMMAYCRPGAEASDYTVQASLVVASSGLAGSFSGISAQLLGHGAHFALGTVACLGSALLACVFAKRRRVMTRGNPCENDA